MRTITISSLLALVLGLAGCASDAGTTTLGLGVSGLEPLGADYVYEGWLIVDGAPVTAGRFSVDADGNATPDAFEVASTDAELATAYVLTIEPAVGDDPAPSAVHVLAGDIRDGTASLSVSHPAAIGTDFSGAAGQFILETPSTMSVADDYENGLWFLVPGMAGMEPGLTLPDLPEGWVYEGWVVNSDGPISTGTFRAVDAADSDAAGPNAGPDGSPPFPGQDFIDPERILTSGYAAVISVEPVPDNSPMPFAIKPLIDTSMDPVMAPATQTMVNMAADTLPSGSVTFDLAE